MVEGGSRHTLRSLLYYTSTFQPPKRGQPFYKVIIAGPKCVHYSEMKMFQMDEEEVYSVPSLGRHYSCHWAMEDMEEERREAGRALENMDTGNRPSARDWQKDSGLNTHISHSHVKLANQHTDPACNKVSSNLNMFVIMDPLYQYIDIALKYLCNKLQCLSYILFTLFWMSKRGTIHMYYVHTYVAQSEFHLCMITYVTGCCHVIVM